MFDMLISEFRKSGAALFACFSILLGGAAVLVVAPGFAVGGDAESVLKNLGVALTAVGGVAMTLVGIYSGGAEYRWGTVTHWVSSTVRSTWLLKLAVMIGASLTLSLAAFATTLIQVFPTWSETPSLLQSWLIIVGGMSYWGVVGCAVGKATRGSVWAYPVVLGYLYLERIVLSVIGVSETVMSAFPSTAGAAFILKLQPDSSDTVMDFELLEGINDRIGFVACLCYAILAVVFMMRRRY